MAPRIPAQDATNIATRYPEPVSNLLGWKSSPKCIDGANLVWIQLGTPMSFTAIGSAMVGFLLFVFRSRRPMKMVWSATGAFALATRMGGLMIRGRRRAMYSLANQARDIVKFAVTAPKGAVSLLTLGEGPRQTFVAGVRQDGVLEILPGGAVWVSAAKRITMAPLARVMRPA